jgi:16S rRNA (guanine966-N2)-methyltransferase
MRIIGGLAAGRLLKVPAGFAVRPTPDLVKQAVFNSLGTRVEDARVLELFGGSGALGLESLSRGASQVVVIEKAAKHVAYIKQNLASVGLPALKFEVRTQDVFAAVPQLVAHGVLFDLILADPPFGEKNLNRRSNSMSQKLLDDPDLPKLLSEKGIFVLGHTKRDTLTLPSVWTEQKVIRHGDSMMRFLTAAEALT